MSQPYVGEIRIFAGNFAPVGWAFCSGQIVPITQNTTLFNLIGTTYGGDGQTTFALPDLRGRRPVHQGQGAGLSPYVLGQAGGTETVTLTASQIASHAHSAEAVKEGGTLTSPAGNVWAQWSDDPYTPVGGATPVAMSPAAIGANGGGQPHDNRSSYLVVNYIISLFGVYPSQS